MFTKIKKKQSPPYSENNAKITAVAPLISGIITLPFTVGGHKVAELAEGAYANCDLITGIDLKKSVDGVLYTNSIAPLGHSDDSSDGRCDVCDADLGTNTPSEGCNCNCRKSGFMNFFRKIINFFHKLFKMEKYHYCDCGNPHW